MRRTISEYIKLCNFKQLSNIKRLVLNEYNERVDFKNQLLTERELDVLRLFCFTNNQISEKLIVSPTTVATHSWNIHTKLYSKNRAEALIKALKQKIIRLEEIDIPETKK